jgi:small-conductance mechanosensitive channel
VRRIRFVFWVAIWGAIGLACVAAETAEHTSSPIPPGASAAVTGAPGAGTGAGGLAAIPTGLPLPADQVVTHVSRTIAWYRGVIALQQVPVDPDDVVPRDRLNQTALTALQLAFDFGHAAAGLAGKPPASTPGKGTASSSASAASPPAPSATGANTSGGDDQSQGQAGDIDRAAARLADRVTSLQSQLSALDGQIAQAAAKDKPTLTAQRGEVSAALDLAKEIQATVGQIQRFEQTSDVNGAGAGGGLAAQIADLQKTVPEIRQVSARGATNTASTSASAAQAPAAPATPTPAAPTPPPASETFRPESAGVIALIGRWFSLEGAKGQLSDAIKQTDALTKDLEAIRAALTQEARSLARQDLDTSSMDAAQLAQAKQQFEAAATRFKQLSTLLIPVGEEGVTVENARNTLSDWHDSISAKNRSVARYLALHLGFLFGSIAIVLIVSDIWRRATFRYLADSRRRQQFLALRRVAVGVALTIVIIFGLVSEVGSLATYAGLITAGLAVALQNVILAVVAYFFLIGRYGVRVGDRITLAGVTGRVVEIGLVRIYLMELIGPELRSSGRMVVLSNAVLFQPTALFKQMPGGDYFWHTIVLTLEPTTDVSSAEKRLTQAADSVYDKYRTAIEQQHAALQRFIDFETAMPRPEVYVRLTDKGLECTVRYPVEPARAATIDQTMLNALREAEAKEPPLKSVGGPVLMAGDN